MIYEDLGDAQVPGCMDYIGHVWEDIFTQVIILMQYE